MAAGGTWQRRLRQLGEILWLPLTFDPHTPRYPLARTLWDGAPYSRSTLACRHLDGLPARSPYNLFAPVCLALPTHSARLDFLTP